MKAKNDLRRWRGRLIPIAVLLLALVVISVLSQKDRVSANEISGNGNDITLSEAPLDRAAELSGTISVIGEALWNGKLEAVFQTSVAAQPSMNAAATQANTGSGSTTAKKNAANKKPSSDSESAAPNEDGEVNCTVYADGDAWYYTGVPVTVEQLLAYYEIWLQEDDLLDTDFYSTIYNGQEITVTRVTYEDYAVEEDGYVYNYRIVYHDGYEVDRELISTEYAEETPAKTSEPEPSSEPEQTEEPEQSAEPEQTEEPEQSEEPEQTEEPEQPEEPEQTEEPEQSEEPEQTEEPEQSEEPVEPVDEEDPGESEEPQSTEGSEAGIVDGYSYVSFIDSVTAYSYCDTGRGASGGECHLGTCAVDPSVIPLGTELYIEGYGYAIANDTGGAIIGNTVDVWLSTAEDCRNWGVRNVRVYILG